MQGEIQSTGSKTDELNWHADACLAVCLGKRHIGGSATRQRATRLVSGLVNRSYEGAAERTGAVWSGEEEAEGGAYCSLQLPERRL